MNEVSEISSPTPGKKRKEEPMSFPEAIIKVNMGEKVTKLEWDDPETYVYLSNGWLCIRHKGDPKDHSMILKEADLRGMDWIVINEKFTN